MLYRGKYLKTTLILGAGATRGGLSSISSQRIYPPLNKDFLQVIARFVQTNEGRKYINYYNKLRKFISSDMPLSGNRTPTMEEIFTILFLSKDLTGIFRSVRGRRRKVGFRPEIRDFLFLLVHIFRFIQQKPNHRLGIDHYEKLARELSDEDTIITLNYDTFLDNALTKNGWNPKIGYGFKVGDVDFEYPITNNSNKKVLLLKPHGSLNWYAKYDRHDLEQALASRPVSKVIMSQIPKAYDIKKERLHRFFIPPLYSKFFKNKFWNKLWELMFKELIKSKMLIIIGCSLTDTDYHLKSIILMALKKRKEKFGRIILVDKSPSTRKKFKQILRGQAKSGFKEYSSFSDFVKSL